MGGETGRTVTAQLAGQKRESSRRCLRLGRPADWPPAVWPGNQLAKPLSRLTDSNKTGKFRKRNFRPACCDSLRNGTKTAGGRSIKRRSRMACRNYFRRLRARRIAIKQLGFHNLVFIGNRLAILANCSGRSPASLPKGLRHEETSVIPRSGRDARDADPRSGKRYARSQIRFRPGIRPRRGTLRRRPAPATSTPSKLATRKTLAKTTFWSTSWTRRSPRCSASPRPNWPLPT